MIYILIIIVGLAIAAFLKEEASERFNNELDITDAEIPEDDDES